MSGINSKKKINYYINSNNRQQWSKKKKKKNPGRLIHVLGWDSYTFVDRSTSRQHNVLSQGWNPDCLITRRASNYDNDFQIKSVLDNFFLKCLNAFDKKRVHYTIHTSLILCQTSSFNVYYLLLYCTYQSCQTFAFQSSHRSINELITFLAQTRQVICYVPVSITKTLSR